MRRFELQKVVFSILIFLPIAATISLAISWQTMDRFPWQAVRHFPVGHLLLVLALSFIPWFTNVFRIINWTHFLGNPLNFREAFKLVLANELGSAITPTAVGGGYVKVAFLMGKKYPLGSALSLMTLGSFEDAVFFLLALPIAAYFSSRHEDSIVFHYLNQRDADAYLLTIITVLLILGFALYLLTRERFTKRIYCRWRFAAKLIAGVQRIRRDFIGVYQLVVKKGKRRFVYSLFLTSMQWSCRYSVLTILLDGLGYKINPLQSFVMQWVVFTMMTFFPTPGATIGAEASFYAVYHLFIPDKIMGTALFAWRFFTFYILLSLALVLLLGLVAANPDRVLRHSGSKKSLTPPPMIDS